jgi:hypothetical protein
MNAPRFINRFSQQEPVLLPGQAPKKRLSAKRTDTDPHHFSFGVIIVGAVLGVIAGATAIRWGRKEIERKMNTAV